MKKHRKKKNTSICLKCGTEMFWKGQEFVCPNETNGLDAGKNGETDDKQDSRIPNVSYMQDAEGTDFSIINEKRLKTYILKKIDDRISKVNTDIEMIMAQIFRLTEKIETINTYILKRKNSGD